MMAAIKNKKILFIILLACIPLIRLAADGCYFSSRKTAVSADQQAIIVHNGNKTSITFSTGYTGEGEDFCWIIPLPAPPRERDVIESGDDGLEALGILEELTSPRVIVSSGGGCFPEGTGVLTPEGPKAIETLIEGDTVYAFDGAAGAWTVRPVQRLISRDYEGDMITLTAGGETLRSTGNHPFFVVEGAGLSFRPEARDVPGNERGPGGPGRWVEARALRVGDVLKAKNGGTARVHGIEQRFERAEVYNLGIDGCHSYTLTGKGILVHNKGGAEETASSTSCTGDPITVYGTVSLKSYEVSILGAVSADALIEWLENHDYRVDRAAGGVLSEYVDRNWAFVAVRLHPEEHRHYENELLPPVTLGYRYKDVVFPLRISSISTVGTVKITLYVLAGSTVTLTNMKAVDFPLPDEKLHSVMPELFIEATMRDSLDRLGGKGLVTLWRGDMRERPAGREAEDQLKKVMKVSFPQNLYLTRFEGRMDPLGMTDDLYLEMDEAPQRAFITELQADESMEDVVEAEDPAALGITGLMRAAMFEGNPDSFEKNITGEGNIDARDMIGATALMYAAGFNDNAVITSGLLHHGADLTVRNRKGWTALMYATSRGNTDAASVLLASGAEVGAKAGDGKTPLILAAMNGHPEMVRLLIENGADIEAANETNGWTPLIRASWMGRIDTVRVLLRAGALVNAKASDGSTALMMAAERAPVEIAEILLEAGADVNAENDNGVTALWKVSSWHWRDNKDMVKVLLDAGANVNIRARIYTFGPEETILWRMVMASRKDLDIMRMLVDAGADMDAENGDGATSIMRAAQLTYPEMTGFFIDAGADVNASDDRGFTPLMHAANQPANMQLLIGAGADLNARNSYGQTALHWAVKRNNPDSVRVPPRRGSPGKPAG